MKKLNLFLILLCLSGIVFASTITLNTPKNNLYTQDTTPDFNFTVIGNNATYNCQIMGCHGGGAYASYSSNTAITNDTYTSITASAMEIATHKWKVNCTNDTGVTLFYSVIRTIDIGKSNYSAMDKLSKFIGDFITFIPKIIALVILGIIIGVVIFLGAWIKKAIGKGQ